MPSGGRRPGAGRPRKNQGLAPACDPIPGAPALHHRSRDSAIVRATSHALLPGENTAHIKTIGDLQMELQKGTDEFIRKVLLNLGAIEDAMLAMATGLTVVDDEGTARYTVPPDRQACEYLLSMAFGKPTQRVQKVQDTTINVVNRTPRPTFKARVEELPAEAEIVDAAVDEE